MKIVHQTWKTESLEGTPYHPAWKASWREVYPGWASHFWTDELNDRLVKEAYPDYHYRYSIMEKGVVKADLARLFYLHYYGGIYADMDFIALRNCEEVLRPHRCLVFCEMNHDHPDHRYPNAMMFAGEPGNDFLLALIEEAFLDWADGETWVEALFGPVRLKRALEKFRPDFVKLPSDYWYPHVWGNPASTEKANRLDWADVGELREAYPDSYAVTPWTHHW